MKENVKLSIYEGVAALASLLVLLFCFLPAYSESEGLVLTDMQLIFGNIRTEANPLLICAFIIVILALLVNIAGAVLTFLGKTDDKISTIFGITGAALVLIGGIILTCSILITGLDKANSELGLIQGNWSIGVANFLVVIFSLISAGFNYPSALIILHHQDLADKNRKAQKNPTSNESN